LVKPSSVANILAQKVWFWAVLPVAIAMLGLMLVPAEFWRPPKDDGIFKGFDRGLIYVDEKGAAPSRGVVEFSPASITLTTLPNSEPTIHLITTPLGRFVANMSVRILQAQGDTIPLRVGIWTPRGEHGVFVVFGTDRSISVQSSAWDQPIKTQTLGPYLPGRLYLLDMSLDKAAGVIHTRVRGVFEGSPSSGRSLRIVGRTSPQWFSHIYSKPVPVDPGRAYTFGGRVKLLKGPGLYGFVVEWLTREGVRLDKSEQWHDVQELRGWTAKEFRARAPADAAFALLEIAVTPGADALYTDLFLKREGGNGSNLLPNGDFRDRAIGWRRGSAEQAPLDLLDSADVEYESFIRYEELPELFNELRVSLTASAAATDGISSAVVQDYVLTLPHQRWFVLRTDDGRARTLTVGLLIIGAILAAGRVAWWVRGGFGPWIQRFVGGVPDARLSSVFAGRRPLALALVGTGGLVYLLLNSPLFNSGSLNYDLLAGTVWGYTIPRYGLSQLYHLTAVTPIPEAWAGTPMQEAAFPYLPVMAYIYFVVGWIYKLFLAVPGPFVRDAFQLAYVIKAFSALFSYASTVLIYLILREQGASRRWSLVSAGAFLFNPAVWLVGSVWGQTQSWSIFFLLLAIWQGQRRNPVSAWLALAAAALTRQQMLVPAILLALVFLRRFSLRENIQGVCWSVVMVFLILAPFLLAIGPSILVDLLANTLHLHVQAFNDRWTTLVSWSALSVWPLFTHAVDGQSGLNRIFYSSREVLIATVPYWQFGNVLFGGMFLAVAGILGVRGSKVASPYGHIPMIAFATLGLFMLKTEFAAFHFLPALALLILSGRSMNTLGYTVSVLILTMTTFISMYSVAGIWMAYNPPLSVGLFDPANPVTRFFKDFLTWDWFITLGCLGNLGVLVWLGITAVRPYLWSRSLAGIFGRASAGRLVSSGSEHD